MGGVIALKLVAYSARKIGAKASKGGKKTTKQPADALSTSAFAGIDGRFDANAVKREIVF
jgi:hypothetical protein